jgi:hypothetical protein
MIILLLLRAQTWPIARWGHQTRVLKSMWERGPMRIKESQVGKKIISIGKRFGFVDL